MGRTARVTPHGCRAVNRRFSLGGLRTAAKFRLDSAAGSPIFAGAMPVLRHIEPCLPSPADRPPSGANWIHEIKHDGYRLMARRDPVGVRLITRRGNDWSDRFPLVIEAVNHLKVRSCLIDGEVVCCDDRGLARFDVLRRRRNEAMAFLYAFDLLELDGIDLRREPIEVRKKRWRASCARAARVRLNVHLEHDCGLTVFQHACQLGCEGIVSKRLGSRYRSGRSPDWLKFKNPAAPAVRREAEEDWGRRR
jgi:bifunctional non-homologous end joining protein LigD